jgi:hypothetical protein
MLSFTFKPNKDSDSTVLLMQNEPRKQFPKIYRYRKLFSDFFNDENWIEHCKYSLCNVFSDQYRSSVTYLSPGTQIGEQNLEKLLYTLYLNCVSKGTDFFKF